MSTETFSSPGAAASRANAGASRRRSCISSNGNDEKSKPTPPENEGTDLSSGTTGPGKTKVLRVIVDENVEATPVLAPQLVVRGPEGVDDEDGIDPDGPNGPDPGDEVEEEEEG